MYDTDHYRKECFLNVKGLGEIKAVAFDIDGTLYPQWKIHLSACLHYFSHPLFFLHYGLVRNSLHGAERLENFRAEQAERMAHRMGCLPAEAELRLNAIVYDGLKKNFDRIACYKDVPETFRKFKEAGLKIALLSDFPPEQKGAIWGIKPYCDVILGTEFLGALKPSAYSFVEMARQLETLPEEILYVGNSARYDVAGARRAGMKSAYLLSGFRKLFNIPLKESDISFSNYRQLQDIVLN